MELESTDDTSLFRRARAEHPAAHVRAARARGFRSGRLPNRARRLAHRALPAPRAGPDRRLLPALRHVAALVPPRRRRAARRWLRDRALHDAHVPDALLHLRLGLRVKPMQATRFPKPVVDGMWNALLLRMLHPGYRYVLRWCDHLAFEDVLRIDRASIAEAATDPKRFSGPIRYVFGNGTLPKTVVPF